MRPGAKGNVATEAVAALMQAQGFETGLDLIKLEKSGSVGKGVGAWSCLNLKRSIFPAMRVAS